MNTPSKRILKKPCPPLQKTTFQPCISSGNLRFDAYKFSTFRNLGNFHLFPIILLHLFQHSRSLCTFTHHSLIFSLLTFFSFLHSINSTCLLPYRYKLYRCSHIYSLHLIPFSSLLLFFPDFRTIFTHTCNIMQISLILYSFIYIIFYIIFT